MKSQHTIAVTESASTDFTTITERPDTRASRGQLSILYTRYRVAARHATGRDVLEAACGAGVGLGLLARVARSVVAGDIDPRNCRTAESTYRGRAGITIRQFDVQEMPFPSGSFDLVVFYEAIYYIPDLDRCLDEVRRVLRPGGVLLVSSVNCEWEGFASSPFCVKYYTPRDFVALLERHGFEVDLFAGFPEDSTSSLSRIVSLIRQIAARLHLIPKTMKGKEWLKRLFYGRLEPIPAELTDDLSPPAPLDRIAPSATTANYRFYYTVATLPGGNP
jgi:SAM-dependent methyltransferase